VIGFVNDVMTGRATAPFYLLWKLRMGRAWSNPLALTVSGHNRSNSEFASLPMICRFMQKSAVRFPSTDRP